MTTETNVMASLYASLAIAQSAFLAIEKNRSVEITIKTGGKYRFRYADLEQILAKTRPALSANGLAIFQVLETQPNNSVLRCELVHKDGGRVSSEVSIPHPHTVQDPKSFGAMVSYYRRYMVTAMLGVSADDDLDEDGQESQETWPSTGQATSHKPAVSQPQRRKAPAKANTEQAGDTTAATQGEIAYLNKKITAKGWTVAQAREAAGLDAADTLDGLTKDGFVALKGIVQ
jgi:hypothetical protein